jgi:hypothetical protein
MPGALFIDAVWWVCDGKSRRYVSCIHGSLHYIPSKASAAYNLTSIASVFGHQSMAHPKNNNPSHSFKFEIPFIPMPAASASQDHFDLGPAIFGNRPDFSATMADSDHPEEPMDDVEQTEPQETATAAGLIR